MDRITTINHSTTRPPRRSEEERLRHRVWALEDKLAKSRRFTTLVGITGFIAGMVFQFIISAPPVWIDHMPTTVAHEQKEATND